MPGVIKKSTVISPEGSGVKITTYELADWVQRGLAARGGERRGEKTEDAGEDESEDSDDER